MNKYITKDNLEEIFTLIKNNTFNKNNIGDYSSWESKTKTRPTNANVGFQDQIDYNHIKKSGNFYIQNAAGAEEEYKIYIALTSSFNISLNYTENYFIYKLDKKFTIQFELDTGLNSDESRVFVDFDKNLWRVNGQTFSSVGNLDYLIIKIKTFKLSEGDRSTILVDLIGTSPSGTIAVACGSFIDGQRDPDLNYNIFNKDWWKKYWGYVKSITYYNNNTIQLKKDEVPIYPVPNPATLGTDQWWNGVYVYIHLKRGCPSYKNMFKDTLVYETNLKNAHIPIDKDYSYMFAGTKFSSWIGWYNTSNTEPAITMPDGANCTGMFKNCKGLQFINSLTSRRYKQNGTDNTPWTLRSNSGGFSRYTCLIDWKGDADWTSMFENCPNLAYVDLDGWKLNKDANIVADNMFAYSFMSSWTGVKYQRSSDLSSIYGVLRLPVVPDSSYPGHQGSTDTFNVIKSYHNMLLGTKYLNYISFHYKNGIGTGNIPYMKPYFRGNELYNTDKSTSYDNILEPGQHCVTYMYNLISEEQVGSLKKYEKSDWIAKLDYIYFINSKNQIYPTDTFKWSNGEVIDFGNTHVCSVCGYAYNEAVGDPSQSIDPGTSWSEIPNTWVCPLCGKDKSYFS